MGPRVKWSCSGTGRAGRTSEFQISACPKYGLAAHPHEPETDPQPRETGFPRRAPCELNHPFTIIVTIESQVCMMLHGHRKTGPCPRGVSTSDPDPANHSREQPWLQQAAFPRVGHGKAGEDRRGLRKGPSSWSQVEM
ncbi:unnamed protein product [Eretmochelys imbricata]